MIAQMIYVIPNRHAFVSGRSQPNEPDTDDGFVWVDTAVGGANRRNNPKKLTSFQPRPDQTDCFATYHRFDRALVEHVEQSKSRGGTASVKGYRGPSMVAFAPFDFDDADDPSNALADVRTLLDHLGALDVPPNAPRVLFSGNKGFTVEIPATLIGSPGPATDTAARVKTFCARLAGDLPTFDSTIYDQMRLLRCPNTIHGTSGLYKIPLLTSEVCNLSIEDIRDLARHPRYNEAVPDDDWGSNPDLLTIWHNAKVADRPKSDSCAGTAPGRILDEAVLGSIVAILGPSYVEGKRHHLAMGLAGWLAREGVSRQSAMVIVEQLSDGDEEREDRLRSVEDTYDRLEAGEDIAGWTLLRENLTEAALTRLTLALWSGRTTESSGSEATTGNPTTGRYPQTDQGNAELLRDLYGHKLRWDHRANHWKVYRDHRWQVDENSEVDRLCTASIRLRQERALSIPDHFEKTEECRWALKSEGRHFTRQMLDAAKRVEPLAHNGRGWDEDPWLLGCANGVVDLRTGLLRPGSPDDGITKTTDVEFHPDSAAPRWRQFLIEIFPDEDLRAYFQRMVGYCLTGIMVEQVCWLWLGRGRNGKSVCLNALQSVFGDYFGNLPWSAFVEGAGKSSPYALAKLPGRRLVSSTEAGSIEAINAERIKTITGGDPMTTRDLYQSEFTFSPTCKLIFTSNHMPPVSESTYALWRRLKVVPFEATFEGTAEDKTLPDALWSERPGILAWAVEGAVLYQVFGLGEPVIVRDHSEDYARETNPLAGWLRDRCDIDEALLDGASTLYESYVAWCDEMQIPVGERKSNTMFGRQLTQQFEKIPGSRIRYRGLSLKSPVP